MSLYKTLLELSLFQCKLCTQRVQYPVMKVKTFGNICGSCYDRSAYTNVKENTTVGTILSTLCISCNYADKGCIFKGKYMKTCEHEKKCCFRDRLCPFTYQNECDEVLKIADVVNHINEKHEDYVVLSENNIIEIRNPTSPNCEIIYLLEINDQHFLLRTKLDVENKHYLYVLYCFDIDGRSNNLNVSFSFVTDNKNLNIKYNNITVVHVSNIERAFDVDALKVSKTMLDSLGCSEVMKILLRFTNDENNEFMESLSMPFECTQCKNYCIRGAYYCIDCKNDFKKCDKCYYSNKSCKNCDSELSFKLLSFSTLYEGLKFPCKNSDCKSLISNDYHNRDCVFRKYVCLFRETDLKCNWEGNYTNLVMHMVNVYGSSHDKGTYTLEFESLRYATFFIIHNNIIKCKYGLSTKGDLSLTFGVIGPSYLDSLYIWEVSIENQNTGRKISYSDNCLYFDDAVAKIVNVRDYAFDNKIKMTVCIKEKDVHGN